MANIIFKSLEEFEAWIKTTNGVDHGGNNCDECGDEGWQATQGTAGPAPIRRVGSRLAWRRLRLRTAHRLHPPRVRRRERRSPHLLLS